MPRVKKEQGGDINSAIRKTKNTLKKIGRVAKIVAPIVQNPVLGTINALPQIKKRDYSKLPPDVRNILTEIGEQKITSIKIVRTPIESFVKTLLNVISLGQYESAVKKSNYDSMMHLALYINGKYTLDKQEVIKLVKNNPIKKNSETLDVDLQGKEITFNELIEKTRQLMGNRNFTSYSAKKNNCQNFVESILRANDLINDEYKNFIIQDAETVFKGMPKITEKLSDFITDTGAVVDRVVEGESVKKKSALMPWKFFVRERFTGKKFKNRQESNEFMKTLSEQYKKLKNKK
jgi:hypothetical protein